MNTRRIVLHLIVALLSFIIGVTAAVALGGFDPLARFTRRYSRQYTVPPHSLSAPGATNEGYRGCRMRSRTAELRYNDFEPSSIPPPPAVPLVPEVPFDDSDAPPPPPSAPRTKR